MRTLTPHFQQWAEHPDQKKKKSVNKETQALNDTTDQTDLLFIEHFIQKQNTLFFQVHIQHSLGQITS